MKKLYLLLIFSEIFSILLMFTFYFFYYYKLRQISYNFKREIEYNIKGMRTFDIKYNSYYFAGHSGNDIYLGNTTAPRHLFKINVSLTDTSSINAVVNRIDFKSDGIYRTYVDSTNFYLFNGYARSILHGKIGEWKASVDPINSPYFHQSIPINEHSIAFRFVSGVTNNNSLRKESTASQSITNEKVLEKQVDGFFCTDGILEYNKDLNWLIYLYYYRNQILVMDTNLNLIKKIKTIDPIESAKFKVSMIKSEHSSTFASPALLVNANCSSWKNYLFVQSKLMGKQEDETRFKYSTVIDIYDLEKSVYLYSIYLPLLNDHPIRQFKVIGGLVYTLTDNNITSYTIKLPSK